MGTITTQFQKLVQYCVGMCLLMRLQHSQLSPAQSRTQWSRTHEQFEEEKLNFVMLQTLENGNGYYKIDIQGVAKRLVNFVSLSVTHFLGLSCCFCALLTVKYGRFFILVLFGHMDEKKVEKFDPE